MCSHPGAVLRHASWPDRSRKFVVVLRSNRWSQDRQNHVAPQSKPNPASQKSNLTTTLLSTCSFFLISDNFIANFCGSAAVCQYFEDLSGKKSFKNQPSTSTYLSYPKEPAYAVGATNMPFEAAQAEIKTFHFLRIQGERSRSFTFLAKVTIEEVFSGGNRYHQSQPAGQRLVLKERHRRHGDAKNQERVSFTIRKRLFLSQQKFKAEQSFSMGIFVGFSDRPGSKEAERRHRSEATKLSGARMPEQRRAGQLVLSYYSLTNKRKRWGLSAGFL